MPKTEIRGIHSQTDSSIPISPVLLERRVSFRHAAQFMGRFSEQIFLFVFIWYLLIKTHSAFQVGIFLICGIVPAAIISPFGGIIRERYQSQKLFAAMSLFRCVLILMLAGSLIDHSLSIWMLDAGAALLALGGAIYNPLDNAIMPHVINQENWTKTVVDQLWYNSGALIGLLAGGFFWSTPGVPFILIICAIVYMIAALLECWFPLSGGETVKALEYVGHLTVRGFIDSLRMGFNYIIGRRQLLLIVGIVLLVNVLICPVLLIFIPYIFKAIPKLSQLELSLVLGSYWAGAVIGIVMIPLESPKGQLRNTFIRNLFTISTLLLLLAIPLLPMVKTTLTVWSVTLINIIIAVFLGLVTVAVNFRAGVLIQARIDAGFQSRVWDCLGAIIAVSGAIGFLAGGYLVQAVSVDWLIIATAIGMAVMAALSSGLKTLREI